MKNNYILVTPIKNEEKNLPFLFKSIKEQTIKPVLWLIIDDGSSDNSTKLINEQSKKCDYIVYKRNEPQKWDLAFHYHEMLSNGFKETINIAAEKNIAWEFIGVLDGDIFFKDNNYYKFLINEFKKDNKLGICSGGTKSFNGKKYIIEKNKKTHPNGCARLISKNCYNTIGYPITPSADSIMHKKARISGFKTKRFENIFAYQSRLTNAGNGVWIGAIYSGHVKYYLGYSFLYILLHSIKISMKYPYYTGLILLFTYLSDSFKRKQKTKDNEIIKMNKNTIYNTIKTKLKK
jgi:glycosyltransferase involved in cell wall biosynthesis